MDAQLAAIREKGIFLTATDAFTGGLIKLLEATYKLSETEREQLRARDCQVSAQARDRLWRALMAGVKIAPQVLSTR